MALQVGLQNYECNWNLENACCYDLDNSVVPGKEFMEYGWPAVCAAIVDGVIPDVAFSSLQDIVSQDRIDLYTIYIDRGTGKEIAEIFRSSKKSWFTILMEWIRNRLGKSKFC